VPRIRERLPRDQLAGLPLREELEALVRRYHHLQNEHKRAPLDSATRRRIEEHLLDVRGRFDRLLEEWVPDDELRQAWWLHLHNREPEPDGPPAIRPLVFRGVTEAAGSVVEIRGRQGEELEVWVDGALVERIAGEKDFAPVAAPLDYRYDGDVAHETFTASPEALDALEEFLADEGVSPPWEYASELLADGLIDTHFALTPRGRRALSQRR
jgi:hypothetical protein